MTGISKVLIIEDSEEIVEAISIALKMRWPQATIYTTEFGEDGIDMVEQKQPEVVILDLGLPDISGYDVLKQVRLFSNVPVIILTVRKEEADVIKGLELGADEYVFKPFRQLELVSRVRAVTRRQEDFAEETAVTARPFVLDLLKSTIMSDAGSVNLTRTESIILAQLMRNQGNIVSHVALAEEIWGTDYPDAPSALKVYIKRLRDKIEPNPGNPKYIVTRSGLGYLFART